MSITTSVVQHYRRARHKLAPQESLLKCEVIRSTQALLKYLTPYRFRTEQLFKLSKEDLDINTH